MWIIITYKYTSLARIQKEICVCGGISYENTKKNIIKTRSRSVLYHIYYVGI